MNDISDTFIDDSIQVPVYCNFSLYRSMSTDAVKNINGSLKGIVIKTDFPKVNGEDIDPTYKTIKMYDVPKKLHKFMYETIETGKSQYELSMSPEDFSIISRYKSIISTIKALLGTHKVYTFPRVGFLQDEKTNNIYTLSESFTPIDWKNVYKLKTAIKDPMDGSSYAHWVSGSMKYAGDMSLSKYKEYLKDKLEYKYYRDGEFEKEMIELVEMNADIFKKHIYDYTNLSNSNVLKSIYKFNEF